MHSHWHLLRKAYSLMAPARSKPLQISQPQILKHFQIFSGTPQHFPTSSKILDNVPGFSNIVKCFPAFSDIFKCSFFLHFLPFSSIFISFLQFSNIFMHFLWFSGTFRNVVLFSDLSGFLYIFWHRHLPTFSNIVQLFEFGGFSVWTNERTRYRAYRKVGGQFFPEDGDVILNLVIWFW